MRPELTAGVRVLASTAAAPMPAFVAAAGAPAQLLARLRAGFCRGRRRGPGSRALAEPLLLEGFAPQ